MKKNTQQTDEKLTTTELYYRSLFERRNVIKEMILGFFDMIASYPRLILEVFIRPDMGRRYFSLATAITIFLLLCAIPVKLYYKFDLPLYRYPLDYPVWYVFVAAFGYFSYLRYREVRVKAGTFDFEHFSKSSGYLLPYFELFKIGKWTPTNRQKEIYLEPLHFFLAGLILFYLGQLLGILLIFCSVVYSLSYAAAYKHGDDFVLDLIDKHIFSRDITESFITGKDKGRGANFRGERPGSNEFRRNLWDDEKTEDADWEDVTDAI